MKGSLSSSAIAAKIAESHDDESIMAALKEYFAASGAKYAVLCSFNYGQSAADQWIPLYSSFPADITDYY